jgi:hypothetical protein
LKFLAERQGVLVQPSIPLNYIDEINNVKPTVGSNPDYQVHLLQRAIHSEEIDSDDDEEAEELPRCCYVDMTNVSSVNRAQRLRQRRKRTTPITLGYEIALPEKLHEDSIIGLSPEERIRRVVEAQKADDFCRKLFWQINHPEMPEPTFTTPYDNYISRNFDLFFYDENGVLFKRATGRNTDDTLVVPRSHMMNILCRYHDDGPHLCKSRMMGEIPRRYFWFGMNKDIHKVVSRCFPCATKTGQGPQLSSPMGLYPLAKQPGDRIHIDLAHMSNTPTKRGNTDILTIVDAFSRLQGAFPMGSTTAEEVIYRLEWWFVDNSRPRILVADNGVQFTGNLLEKYCKNEGIEMHWTAPFSPQSNGLAEHANKMIRDFVSRAMEDTNDLEWDEILPRALCYQRAMVNQSTGYSPFFIEHGRPMRFHGPDLFGEDMTERYNEDPDYVTRLVRITRSVEKTALRNAEKAQEEMAKRYDERQKNKDLVARPGDRVWWYDEAAARGPLYRLIHPYTGPWLVLQQYSPGRYLVVRADGHGDTIHYANGRKLSLCAKEIAANAFWDGMFAYYNGQYVKPSLLNAKPPPEEKTKPGPKIVDVTDEPTSSRTDYEKKADEIEKKLNKNALTEQDLRHKLNKLKARDELKKKLEELGTDSDDASAGEDEGVTTRAQANNQQQGKKKTKKKGRGGHRKNRVANVFAVHVVPYFFDDQETPVEDDDESFFDSGNEFYIDPLGEYDSASSVNDDHPQQPEPDGEININPTGEDDGANQPDNDNESILDSDDDPATDDEEEDLGDPDSDGYSGDSESEASVEWFPDHDPNWTPHQAEFAWAMMHDNIACRRFIPTRVELGRMKDIVSAAHTITEADIAEIIMKLQEKLLREKLIDFEHFLEHCLCLLPELAAERAITLICKGEVVVIQDVLVRGSECFTGRAPEHVFRILRLCVQCVLFNFTSIFVKFFENFLAFIIKTDIVPELRNFFDCFASNFDFMQEERPQQFVRASNLIFRKFLVVIQLILDCFQVAIYYANYHYSRIEGSDEEFEVPNEETMATAAPSQTGLLSEEGLRNTQTHDNQQGYEDKGRVLASMLNRERRALRLPGVGPLLVDTRKSNFQQIEEMMARRNDTEALFSGCGWDKTVAKIIDEAQTKDQQQQIWDDAMRMSNDVDLSVLAGELSLQTWFDDDGEFDPRVCVRERLIHVPEDDAQYYRRMLTVFYVRLWIFQELEMSSEEDFRRAYNARVDTLVWFQIFDQILGPTVQSSPEEEMRLRYEELKKVLIPRILGWQFDPQSTIESTWRRWLVDGKYMPLAMRCFEESLYATTNYGKSIFAAMDECADEIDGIAADCLAGNFVAGAGRQVMGYYAGFKVLTKLASIMKKNHAAISIKDQLVTRFMSIVERYRHALGTLSSRAVWTAINNDAKNAGVAEFDASTAEGDEYRRVYGEIFYSVRVQPFFHFGEACLRNFKNQFVPPSHAPLKRQSHSVKQRALSPQQATVLIDMLFAASPTDDVATIVQNFYRQYKDPAISLQGWLLPSAEERQQRHNTSIAKDHYVEPPKSPQVSPERQGKLTRYATEKLITALREDEVRYRGLWAASAKLSQQEARMLLIEKFTPLEFVPPEDMINRFAGTQVFEPEERNLSSFVVLEEGLLDEVEEEMDQQSTDDDPDRLHVVTSDSFIESLLNEEAAHNHDAVFRRMHEVQVQTPPPLPTPTPPTVAQQSADVQASVQHQPQPQQWSQPAPVNAQQFGETAQSTSAAPLEANLFDQMMQNNDVNQGREEVQTDHVTPAQLGANVHSAGNEQGPSQQEQPAPSFDFTGNKNKSSLETGTMEAASASNDHSDQDVDLEIVDEAREEDNEMDNDDGAQQQENGALVPLGGQQSPPAEMQVGEQLPRHGQNFDNSNGELIRGDVKFVESNAENMEALNRQTYPAYKLSLVDLPAEFQHHSRTPDLKGRVDPGVLKKQALATYNENVRLLCVTGDPDLEDRRLLYHGILSEEIPETFKNTDNYKRFTQEATVAVLGYRPLADLTTERVDPESTGVNHWFLQIGLKKRDLMQSRIRFFGLEVGVDSITIVGDLKAAMGSRFRFDAIHSGYFRRDPMEEISDGLPFKTRDWFTMAWDDICVTLDQCDPIEYSDFLKTSEGYSLEDECHPGRLKPRSHLPIPIYDEYAEKKQLGGGNGCALPIKNNQSIIQQGEVDRHCQWAEAGLHTAEKRTEALHDVSGFTIPDATSWLKYTYGFNHPLLKDLESAAEMATRVIRSNEPVMYTIHLTKHRSKKP